MLTKIPGPQFLLIFAALSAASILLSWYWANLDGSRDHKMPGPNTLDPILISALSGGKNAVIRTVIFDLWNRNLIKISGEDASAIIEGVPSSEKRGSAIHESVYQYMLRGVKLKQPSQLFTDAVLNAEIDFLLQPTFRELERQRLLQSTEDLSRTRLAFWTALLIIAGIGGTKLVLGISRHKPVGFLVAELIISFIALLAALRPWGLKPTRLGYRYLKRLKKHFGWMQEHLSKKNHYTGIDPVFAVAIFGVSPLIGSPLFDPFGKAFRTGSTNQSGGCGGSSGCSGGGGGGGCGGCGGCGGD